MNTNYQMIKELIKVYTPARRGRVSINEFHLINEKLCIDEMNILQLRNLRDMVVMYFSIDGREDIDAMDKMSAITAVIDQRILHLGGEV